MQNEKNNKHWKDKLEETGSFAYAPPGKELAWEKLNTRLQEKKRRKSAVWCGLAAACLLPLIVFIVLRNAHQPAFTATNFKHKPSAIKSFIDIEKEQKKMVVITPDHQIVGRNTAPHKVKERTEMAAAQPKKISPPIDSVTTNDTEIFTTPKDSANNIASVTLPQKKKLKVVHINELNEPDESDPVMVHEYPRFLPLQLARESVYPEPVKVVNRIGFANLKKKSIN